MRVRVRVRVRGNCTADLAVQVSVGMSESQVPRLLQDEWKVSLRKRLGITRRFFNQLHCHRPKGCDGSDFEDHVLEDAADARGRGGCQGTFSLHLVEVGCLPQPLVAVHIKRSVLGPINTVSVMLGLQGLPLTCGER